MSRHFSQFPNGNPPQDDDRFLFGRADPSSPTGFSNYYVTWAEIVAAIGGGPVTPSFMLMEDDVSYILMEDGVSKIQLQ